MLDFKNILFIFLVVGSILFSDNLAGDFFCSYNGTFYKMGFRCLAYLFPDQCLDIYTKIVIIVFLKKWWMSLVDWFEDIKILLKNDLKY